MCGGTGAAGAGVDSTTQRASPTLRATSPNSDPGTNAGAAQQFRRSFIVGAGMACDIMINYPLWIMAKRLGVGLPALPPTIAETYKGGGSLWLSLGPTTMVEDGATHQLQRLFGFGNQGAATADPQRDEMINFVCAAISGAVAGCTVTAQVEHVITASHTKSLSLLDTTKLLHTRHGLRYLLAPPGLGMMCLREAPFAASLFYIRPVLGKRFVGERRPDESLTERFIAELQCGAMTAAIAGPVSHVPSVIGAYQQGHGVSFRGAVSDLLAAGGWRELWRGLPARTLSLCGTMTVVPIVMDFLTRNLPSAE